MSNFKDWCNETESSASTHKLHRLSADPAKLAHAVTVIAKAVPEYYAAPSRVAGLLKKLGKPAAAKFIEEKLPTLPAIKSGDLGEILCSESPRVLRRLQLLRRWSHEQVEQVFTRGP